MDPLAQKDTNNLDLLHRNAVEEALKGNWKEAVRVNELLLKKDSKNKEALNRLARACLELGKIPKAKTTYKKVLKLDPYNAIAQKALLKLESLKEIQKANSQTLIPTTQVSNLLTVSSANLFTLPRANLFIEEPGKTKSVTLIHLGATSLLFTLDAGQLVKLEPHAHRVSVLTEHNDYIGRLPDDLSRRIIKLTSAGNKYISYVRSVSPESVRIFIKEIERCLDLKDIPSFPSQDRTSYVAFTSPDDIHDERPDVTTAEEEDSNI